jgi:hypothetical protein
MRHCSGSIARRWLEPTGYLGDAGSDIDRCAVLEVRADDLDADRQAA